MPFLFSLPLILLWLVFSFLNSRRIAELERQLQATRRRLDALERDLRAGGEPAARTEPAAGPAPAAAPALVSRPAPAAPAAAPARHGAEMEQWVGAVALQNIGAVLLLVGFFFLVLWGYSTHRFGPGVLVAAGVATGLGVVWRGDRLQRSVRGVGHALIGVGAGSVWLSLYLGHTTLHALPSAWALPLLFAASAFTAALGLRYGVQGIAALGVLGAFLPNALQLVVPLTATPMSPWALLAYLVPVNLLVFALALRSGWSALALASVLLTAITWSASVVSDDWSWPLQIALSALFTALGTAPLPRLARAEGRVRPIDLAVIAVAPVAMLSASWPMFALARAEHVAILLGTLAALHFALAWAVDRVRPERDLWRPLTAASTLFLVVATERAVGPEYTGLAWTVEGAVLVVLGMSPRSAWLRACGSVVAAGAFVRLLVGYSQGLAAPPAIPFVHPEAIREAVAITALLVGAACMRASARGSGERLAAHVWLAGGNLLVTLWLLRESHLLARALETGSGAWRALPDLRAAPSGVRYLALFTASTGLALMAQATWLAWRGTRVRRLASRLLAYACGVVAVGFLCASMASQDAWGRHQLPLVNRDALIGLGAIALATAVSSLLTRARPALGALERRVPEVWAVAASFLMLLWLEREADHVARVMLDVPGAMAAGWSGVATDLRDRVLSLAAILATVGWLLQALVAFVLGWRRRSAFLRWMSLALLALTLVKFVLVDLAQADPFWRFLTALVAGAAMLALSFVYQRLGVGRGARATTEAGD